MLLRAPSGNVELVLIVMGSEAGGPGRDAVGGCVAGGEAPLK